MLGIQAQSLQEVRQRFHEVVMEPKQTKAFHEFLQESPLNTSTINAYRAVSEAMMARVVWNPVSKLSQVIKYADQMDAVIKSDADNIEARFLRFSIEYNIPKFLGMSKHLEEDRDMIVQNLSHVATMDLDPSYGQYILSFLTTTQLCSEQELTAMKESLAFQSNTTPTEYYSSNADGQKQ